MKIGERLATLMSQRGLSEGELGRRSGVSQPTIHRIVTGESKNPRQDNVEAIAKAIGVSSAWLWNGGDVETVSSDNPVTELQPYKYYRYPVLSQVNAGEGAEIWDYFEPENAEDWLLSTENAGENGYWLTVEGASMTAPTAPSFPEGTRVLIQPEGFHLLSGKYYIAQNNAGEATFKRYLRDSGKEYLAPLNPEYRTFEMGDNWHIVGRVLDAKIPKGVL